MKRYILSLIFCLMILPVFAFGQESPHTFSKYSSLLSTEVYPNITKFIKELKIKKALTQNESQEIANGTFQIILSILNDNKVTTIVPPLVVVSRMGNSVRDIYIMEVTLVFFDGEESKKNILMTSMMFGKRFILFVDEKSKIEV